MANTLKFAITAVDGATRTIQQIKASFRGMTQPIRDVRNSFGNFGKEVGFPKMAEQLKKVRSSVSEVTASVRGLLAPLLAVVGGGTIAGLIEMTSEWAHWGFQVDQTARSLGLTTQGLQQLQGAARIMGIETGALDNGLKSLGDTLEDALYGRNATAMMMLNRLGIRIHKTKDGAIDTAAAFQDLAGVISKIKSPQVQGLVARNFGVEQLLPLLRKGPQAIAEYEAQARSFGAVLDGPAAQGAERLGLSLNLLQLSLTGLKNSIGAELAPILGPLIDDLTKWISTNRELIAQKIGDWAKGFSEWIRSIDFGKVLDGVTRFVVKVGDLVDALGGWKNIAAGFAAMMAAQFIAPIVSLTSAMVSLSIAAAPLLPVFAEIAAVAGALGAGAWVGYQGYKAIQGTKAGDIVGDSIGNVVDLFTTKWWDKPLYTPPQSPLAWRDGKPRAPGDRPDFSSNGSSPGGAPNFVTPLDSGYDATPNAGIAPPASEAQKSEMHVYVTAEPGLKAVVRPNWSSGLSFGSSMVPGQ